MSHLSLPALSPSDPENLLSRESRQRIRAAYMAAELIRTQALSRLQTRYNAEPSSGVGFADYLRSGSASIEVAESNVGAARKVLRVQAAEYQKLGLPFSRFTKIMRWNIEAAVNSLELSQLQNQVLELEFVWAIDEKEQQVEDERRPAERGKENLSAADRVRDFMRKRKLTVSAFARLIRISDRTVGSVLAGDRVGMASQVAVAKALATTPEELFPE
jgi:hypothetical protein